MSPDQFLVQLQKQGPAPAYLFLGPEYYMRQSCRRALLEVALPPEERETGFTRADLDQVPLAEALDDARSFSLFATHRVIWLGSAEDAPSKTDAALLAGYLRDPPPGVVLVVEASRYDFEGEDRGKIERVQKFYSSIPAVVEFRRFTLEAARYLAQSLARQAGLQIGLAEIGLLVEALGGDAARIAVEIEKLSIFAGAGRKITADDIARLVPDAHATTVFALVAALGRNDRTRALELLDTLVREGEYLPLALTFLATQFRLALAASEEGLKSAQQIQAHFSRMGIRIWRDRAEQVYQTVAAFSKEKLELALQKIFAADRGLRDTRPDDRIVMEKLILALTAQ